MPGSPGHPGGGGLGLRGVGAELLCRRRWRRCPAPRSPAPQPGPEGSRSPLPGQVQPPLPDSARPAAASRPPRARLAPAVSPSVRADTRRGSPHPRLGVPSPPFLCPPLRSLLSASPLRSLPRPASSAPARSRGGSPRPNGADPLSSSRVCGNRRGALAALAAAAAWGEAGAGGGGVVWERRQLPSFRRISGWGPRSPGESEGVLGGSGESIREKLLEAGE